MEELLQWLCAIYPLSPECLSHLRGIIRYRTIKKGQLVLEAGNICENLYFIKKGLLRCYYFKKGKQVTDWFLSENETVVAVKSYYQQQPSDEYIDALEDAELFYITHYDLDYLFEHYLEFNVIGCVLYKKYFLIWHEQASNLRRLTVLERYRHLLATQPEAVLRVPLYVLASFLNMSPETLSRLRSKRIT